MAAPCFIVGVESGIAGLEPATGVSTLKVGRHVSR